MTGMDGQGATANGDVDELVDRVEVDPARRAATLTFLRGAVLSLLVALVSGVLGMLHYIPPVAKALQGLGVHFPALRPIHTTFATVFIFLGAIAVVHRYFEDVAGPMDRPERMRLRVQVILWSIAGVGTLLSLLAGVFSGREYMGFHPLFSIPILLGWVLMTWSFYAHLARGFFHRPVHVTMWGVALVLFCYTFVEQHGWLLPGVFSDPIVDMRVQWKATGTLVGSFNLLVYGTLYYLACKLTNDERYAHSRLAYALFGIGLLNTFTNFGHHTYHLPQSEAVKWISFVISMLEIVLLARVVWDIAAMVRAGRSAPASATQLFLASAKWWTAYILATSIIISVPPINTLIHGTTVVMAHAMGAEIGIDGMALFAAFCWMLTEMAARRGASADVFASRRLRRLILGLNVSAALFIGWLTISGTLTGVRRYDNMAPPQWLEASNHYVLAVCGGLTAWFLLRLVMVWLRFLYPRLQPDVMPTKA